MPTPESTRRPFCLRRVAAFFTIALTLAHQGGAQDDPSRDATIVETILRLEGFDLAGSEKAQAAVSRYLKANWGEDRYLDLIRHFQLKDETPGLLKLALERAETPAGAEAAELLVEIGAEQSLVEALASDEPGLAVKAAKAISHTGSETLYKELRATVENQARPGVVRSAALAGLYGRAHDRHRELLASVKADELDEELKQTAAEILLLSRDEKVRGEAISLFAAAEEYPPIEELAKRKGDPVNGKLIFAQKTCAICHVADDMGINFGPGLSEIGDKLDKKALYDAIINPSAGISMGFEGWDISLKDGGQLLGIVEETEDKLTVKMIGGAARTLKSEEVATKKKLTRSLMYPGLHKMMTPGEMVDLVEFLSGLKKPQEE